MPASYVVRVIEGGEVIDTMYFDTRASLALFFENGAKLIDTRTYIVSRTA